MKKSNLIFLFILIFSISCKTDMESNSIQWDIDNDNCIVI